MTSFEKQVAIWTKRRQQMGDGAVGRKGEDVHKQGQRTHRYLREYLQDNFYQHGVELGCGWGRFTDVLAAHCSHFWAIDVFPDWVERAAQPINTTPICLIAPKLPMADKSMELIADLQTLQSLDGALLLTYSKELRRVAAPGATVISMHAVRPAAIRAPEQRAKMLGLAPGFKLIEVSDIDDAKEYYTFLVGVRA